jgi:hypothetical protein
MTDQPKEPPLTSGTKEQHSEKRIDAEAQFNRHRNHSLLHRRLPKRDGLRRITSLRVIPSVPRLHA